MITLHDLEAGLKVKFDTCRRVAEYNFQEVVFQFPSIGQTKSQILVLFDIPPPRLT